MLKVKEAVIVEGKYDKIKLSNLLDALIIETNGFSVYKDKKTLAFINHNRLRADICLFKKFKKNVIVNSLYAYFALLRRFFFTFFLTVYIRNIYMFNFIFRDNGRKIVSYFKADCD